jgi:Uncharacterised nucleotidyltransferase
MLSHPENAAVVGLHDDGAESIWLAAGRMAARAPSLEDLRLHRIHLVAVRQWRAAGVPVPEPLAEEQHASTMLELAATFVLQRARAAYDGRIVLMKGLEVATYYPESGLRPFRDLDLLVDDAERAQQALLHAGFELAGDERLYRDIHHLQPLRWPGVGPVVEIHDRLKWVDWRRAPHTAELLDAAVASRTGVDRVDALSPAQHVVALAVHSWAHDPLARIGHLLDVAALVQTLSRRELGSVASVWGVERVWRATLTAADALFEGGNVPLPLGVWAGHLGSVRERTVLESHLERWLSPFWSRPPRLAVAAALGALRRDVLPEEGEAWSVKAGRTAQALRTPLRRLSQHRKTLAEKSVSGPSFLTRRSRGGGPDEP